MIYLDCDYNNGCHPKVLEALTSTNAEFSGSSTFHPHRALV